MSKKALWKWVTHPPTFVEKPVLFLETPQMGQPQMGHPGKTRSLGQNTKNKVLIFIMDLSGDSTTGQDNFDPL